MRHRIRRVLLLGSRYDAFILREAGFVEPGEPVPTILGVQATCTYAQTGDEALAIVERGEADLVLTPQRLLSDDPFDVARRIKEAAPSLPVVLITSNPAFHGPLTTSRSIAPFDYVFAWHGQTEVLRAVVLMIEDRLNADHDLLVGGVQLILLVEDEPALYSLYLPMIYEEICQRADELAPSDEGEERSKRFRARTKVMLATSYEEALIILNRYSKSLCGVLTDLEFPRDGKIDSESGLHLSRLVRFVRQSIPVVIQSRDKAVEHRAHDAGAFYIWKESDHFLNKLHTIILDYFGFGDFVFRDGEGHEVARATTLEELSSTLLEVDHEVFEHHAKRNHFSTWLFIHGEHGLARDLRSKKGTSEASKRAVARAISDAAVRHSNSAE